MSRELIDRSPALALLEAQGYMLNIIDDALLEVKDVPHVTTAGEIRFASLVMVLTLHGNVAAKPGDHVAYWTGSMPCTSEGESLSDNLGGGSGGHGRPVFRGSNVFRQGGLPRLPTQSGVLCRADRERSPQDPTRCIGPAGKRR